jgi:hypothetical protein
MADADSTTLVTFIEIPDTEGYDAGSDGHVYTRRIPFYGGLKTERVQLKEKCDRDGYSEVSIYLNGYRKSFKVHRLILVAFKGPCPAGMMSCHFPSIDRSNNRPDNLIWGTASTNQLHRREQGTASSRSRNIKAKLTEEIVAEIRVIYASGGVTQVQLAERFNVFASTVGRIVRGDTWCEPGLAMNFQSRCGPKRGRKPRHRCS